MVLRRRQRAGSTVALGPYRSPAPRQRTGSRTAPERAPGDREGTCLLAFLLALGACLYVHGAGASELDLSARAGLAIAFATLAVLVSEIVPAWRGRTRPDADAEDADAEGDERAGD